MKPEPPAASHPPPSGASSYSTETLEQGPQLLQRGWQLGALGSVERSSLEATESRWPLG